MMVIQLLINATKGTYNLLDGFESKLKKYSMCLTCALEKTWQTEVAFFPIIPGQSLAFQINMSMMDRKMKSLCSGCPGNIHMRRTSLLNPPSRLLMVTKGTKSAKAAKEEKAISLEERVWQAGKSLWSLSKRMLNSGMRSGYLQGNH